MPATPEDLQNALAQLVADSNLYHDVVHGAIDETVVLEGATVPTVAKAISDIASMIATGFEAGFIVSVPDSAARLLSTPTQIGQMLIQVDTSELYYSTSLVMGSWVFHPVQDAASDAAAAVAAVATLTTSLGLKMTTATYVGALASGHVLSAEKLKPVTDHLNTQPSSTRHVPSATTGSFEMSVAALPNGAGTLVDGVDKRTTVYNTSRRCLAAGTNFAIIGSPKRMVSWGAQPKVGILGTGVSGTNSQFPRSAVARQQPDREFPNFDPLAINSLTNEVVEVLSQGAATLIRTESGLVFAAGANGQGVAPLFGSGIDKAQNVFMPIYFNSGDVNMPIKMMDVVDSTTSTAHSTAVFVDTTENVWLVTTNPKSAGYGNSLVGQQRIPVKLNPGYPDWEGKIVEKVRCDTSGGIYILFTNGELWAGGGSNVTGLLGTGSTSAVLNPLQIATSVDDFEVSGHGSDTSLALWILQGTTLKAAGFNGFGQFNRGNYTNSSSFVEVATDVNLVRMGGTDNVTLMWRTTAGSWYGTGQNTEGIFGQNTTAQKNHTAVLLVNLINLVTDNGALVDLCISGYASKHSVCAVFANGQAYTCGNNSNGCLANGVTTAAKTWQRVNWSPLDSTEKIVDISAATGPGNVPAFTWRTSYGRVLQAGSAASGFCTGIAPAVTYNMLSAAPVQLSVIL